MLAALSHEQLSPYLNNNRYTGDGIAMVASLIEKISPSRPENRLQDVRDLSSLEQGSQESTFSYMSRVRGFATRLKGVTIDDIVPLFTLIGMNHDQYSGLLDRFTSGEPAIVNATTSDLERLMLEEDSCRRAMGIQPMSGQSSANRAQDVRPKNDEAKTSVPRHPPRGTPPDSLVYPPEGGIKWKVLKGIVEGEESCPHCHSRDEFH
jgi:hypothetical protein